jgi:hypothetical protein
VMGKSRIALLLSIAALGVSAAGLLGADVAQADSAGATIHSLPASEVVSVSAEFHHQCIESSCVWFAEASAYSTETPCPFVFDPSHGDWTGPIETTAGTSRGTFTVAPYGLPRYIHVCLYVYAEDQSLLIGESHSFDRFAGREIPPQPSSHLRSCGIVHAQKFPWRVTHSGPASCSVADHTMDEYLHGAGTPNYKTGIIGYRTLHDGWECGEIGKEAEPTCARRVRSGTEVIKAKIT